MYTVFGMMLAALVALQTCVPTVPAETVNSRTPTDPVYGEGS